MKLINNALIVARQGPKSPTVTSITVMCPRLRVTIYRTRPYICWPSYGTSPASDSNLYFVVGRHTLLGMQNIIQR